MKKNKNKIEVLFLENKLTNRESDAIPCPKCLGYCEKESTTKEERKQYQTCGRPYECCLGAFVCKRCGLRVVSRLEAPECGW